MARTRMRATVGIAYVAVRMLVLGPRLGMVMQVLVIPRSSLKARPVRRSRRAAIERRQRSDAMGQRRISKDQREQRARVLSRELREGDAPTLRRRRGIVGLALFAAGAMGIMTLYQL